MPTREELPFISAVRKLCEDSLGFKSPFHLAACSQCGGPSFQQPCSLCGYYPMGVYATKPEKPTISCEGFERAIDRSGVDGKGGNVATWLARSYMKTVAYQEEFSFRARADDMLVLAQSLEGLPAAAEIYDLVALQDMFLTAPLFPSEDVPASPSP